jgi:hypothetical protein
MWWSTCTVLGLDQVKDLSLFRGGGGGGDFAFSICSVDPLMNNSVPPPVIRSKFVAHVCYSSINLSLKICLMIIFRGFQNLFEIQVAHPFPDL